MNQIQIKLTDEERTDSIYQPVRQNAAAAATVDTLIKAHPGWKDVPRRKIEDRTCNPFHDKFAKKWKPIYTSTFKHFQAQCKTPLQATSLHTSVAISELIKKVLGSLNCTAIEIASEDGNTEIRILTIDNNSKPMRTKVDAIKLQDYFGKMSNFIFHT